MAWRLLVTGETVTIEGLRAPHDHFNGSYTVASVSHKTIPPNLLPCPFCGCHDGPVGDQSALADLLSQVKSCDGTAQIDIEKAEQALAGCPMDLRARVEVLEVKYETQRLATLEWGNDVDKLMRWIDDHLKRIMALEQRPSYIRQHHNDLNQLIWQGADHPDGPWRPIPAPQAGLPWLTDGPAVPESREPASVAAQARPLSPDTRAVLAAIDGYDTPRITVAQAFRALAFLRPIETLAPAQLIRIAEELDP